MNTENHIDESNWDDLVFDAVRYAREHITALPSDLQPTAFDILVASLERDIGPPIRYAAARSRGHRPRRSGQWGSRRN